MTEKKTFQLPLASLTLIYLALPLLIFFVGWLKPIFALLASVPILFCGWRLIREWPTELHSCRLPETGFVIAFSFALTAFVGIGGFAFQDFDWIKHNAVLFDCVNLPWPVFLADSTTKWPLVYYLAYYLPAALVGKIAGYAAAQVALWIWSSIGLALSCFWFARLTQLPTSVAAIAFFAFSGWDFFANLLVQIIGLSDNHGALKFYPNESWAKIWQFPSHFWMLQWSPGQALAAWLAAGLFLSAPNLLWPICFCFLFTCALLWTPFVAVGLFLLAIFLSWRERPEFSGKLVFPIVSLIFPLGALIAFFATKISPDVAARFGKIPVNLFMQFHYAPSPLKSVFLLFLFIVLEFGIFLWFIRACFQKCSHERNLANACGLSLILLLPITMGYESDLSMRASAVPLFAVAVLLARTILSVGLSPRMRRCLWLVILMGALTPAIEAARQSHNILIDRHDPRTEPHQVSAVMNMPGHDHLKAQYVGSTNSFFVKNLIRENGGQ